MNSADIEQIRAQREVYSKEVEKRTGFKRSKKTVNCQNCGKTVPVVIVEYTVEEGGFIKYSPSRVEEYSEWCLAGCRSMTNHQVIHRQGVKFLSKP